MSGDLMAPFAYSPLEDNGHSFRLFILMPYDNDVDDALKGELIHTSLNNHPTYDGLSYVWGSSINSKSALVLNNCEFLITENLEIALKRIRFQYIQRILWVDQICIDQGHSFTSLRERSLQVRLMGHIYRNAQRVLLWLGPDELAWQVGARESVEKSISGLDPLQRDSLNKMLLLMWFRKKNPVWQRIWVIQELSLAKEIIMYQGSVNVPWEAVMALNNSQLENTNVDTIQYISNTKAEIGAMSAICTLRDELSKKAHRSLRMLLEKFSGWEASNHRDKIYAILGLCSDTLGIIPDYSSPVEVVFTSVTKAILLQEKTLAAALSHCYDLEDDTAANSFSCRLLLPSWVPDYTVQQDAFFSSSNGTLLFSAGGVKAETLSIYNNQLKVAGRHLFSIANLCKHRSISQIALKFTTRREFDVEAEYGWHLLPSDLECNGKPGLSEGVYSDIVWRSLLFDKDSSGKRLQSESIAAFRQEFRDWYDCILLSGARPSSRTNFRLALWVGSGAKMIFAFSDDGNLLRVPPSTKVGDLVCILDGAPAPVVLRHVGNVEHQTINKGNDILTYRIIGPSYCHGFMDGQGLARPKLNCGQFNIV